MIDLSKYNITIENPKGSYKSFEIENDPLWSGYPLKGVTYPVDYGSIEGYRGEDGTDLDIFVGSGTHSGYIVVRRPDVPLETKMFANVTEAELEEVQKAFMPVLEKVWVLDADAFAEEIAKFKLGPRS